MGHLVPQLLDSLLAILASAFSPGQLHLAPLLIQQTRLLDPSLTLPSNHIGLRVRRLDSSLSSPPTLTGYVRLLDSSLSSLPTPTGLIFSSTRLSMSLFVSHTSCCIKLRSVSLVVCVIGICIRSLGASQVTALCIPSIVRVFTSHHSRCDSDCITS